MNTGTRSKVFITPGAPQDVREKIDDAALVHRLTGVVAHGGAAGGAGQGRRRRCEHGANTVLTDAYETAVGPLLAELQEGLGVPTDPLRAVMASDERTTRTAERVGAAAGW